MLLRILRLLGGLIWATSTILVVADAVSLWVIHHPSLAPLIVGCAAGSAAGWVGCYLLRLPPWNKED
jgi:hypothetical protein